MKKQLISFSQQVWFIILLSRLWNRSLANRVDPNSFLLNYLLFRKLKTLRVKSHLLSSPKKKKKKKSHLLRRGLDPPKRYWGSVTIMVNWLNLAFFYMNNGLYMMIVICFQPEISIDF